MNNINTIRDARFWQGHPDIALYNNCLYIAFRRSDRHLTSGKTSIQIFKSVDFETFEYDCSISSDKVLNCPRLSVLKEKLYLIVDEIDVDHRGLIPCENEIDRTSIRIFIYNDVGFIELSINRPQGILPSRIIEFNGNCYLATHSKRGLNIAKPNASDSFASKYESEQKNGHLYQMIWEASSPNQIWTKITEIENTELNLCEASLFVIDSILVCLMRENSNRGLPAYYVWSKDGKIWSKPVESRLFGCHRPVGGQLKSGKVLVTYREQSHITEPKYWARNALAAIIEPYLKNFQLSFDRGIILPIDHDRSLKPDSGYTSWVQEENGNIYVVNYITDDFPKAHIRVYRIEENDFCFNKHH